MKACEIFQQNMFFFRFKLLIDLLSAAPHNIKVTVGLLLCECCLCSGE